MIEILTYHLLIVSLKQDILAPPINTREVERGSVIVAVVPYDTKIVLQV